MGNHQAGGVKSSAKPTRGSATSQGFQCIEGKVPIAGTLVIAVEHRVRAVKPQRRKKLQAIHS